jgi:hypothetical protein
MIPDGRLTQDLRDIFVWLEHRHRAQGDIWFHVMRAPSQPAGKLSIATVDTDRKDLDIGRLHSDFLAALATLGYHLAWPEDGADPEDVDVSSGPEMSHHERLASVARIEQAMCTVLPLRRGSK